MCGIAGIVSPGAGGERSVIERMTEALRHRGPDAGGTWGEGHVALGSRRLAILDVRDVANQPFADEAGTAVVTHNGEVYNFQSLRRELEGRGCRFRTRSDTEVLVHGWRELGAGIVPRLRGMFALAVFDAGTGELLLARDRLGKKPLYYSASPERFAFGSEIKALLRVPGLDRGLDERSILDYAAYGNSVGEHTVFREIRQLLPGHTLRLDTRALDRGRPLEPHIERYWQLEAEPERGVPSEVWLERLDEALAESVRLRMLSDVPLGAFLSGGVDSSLVVAYMARQARERVKTFSIGFEERAFDESPAARAVAEHLGAEHRVEIVQPDAVGILPDLVETYDEPFADASAIPTYYLSRMTREHVTVALSGDGGDELFCGYERYRQCLWLDRAARLATPVGRALARRLRGAFRPDTFLCRALGRASRTGFDLYHDALGYREEFLSLLRRELADRLPDPADGPAARAFRHGSGGTLLERYRATDLAHYLPQDILVKVDRASMRHSLEVRCPLLDHRVVELAARIPPEPQMGIFSQKLLLRRLAARHVPRELLERPKKGFSVPLQQWFRGELAPVFREVLDDAASPAWNYFDLATARRRFRDHLAGHGDSGHGLWRLLYFHRWCDAFLRA